MEKYEIAGIKVTKRTFKEVFFNKSMYIAYLLLLIALFGIIDVVYERYFLLSATAFDAGLNPGSREVADSMREAVFGDGGEVKREAPWSLYIVNYMYMIYVGSGIVFIVALAELANIELVKKAAVGFLTIGLAMVLAGLFTIMMDLNILTLHWMILSPQFSSGMWLMLPLYMVYVPLVILEIYLLLSQNKAWVKKIALGILIVSIFVELAEFYIQAKLFNMNSARHLWTTYPILPLYLIVSSFTASLAIMILYSFLVHKSVLLIYVLEKALLYGVIALGTYEAISYLYIDKQWTDIIVFGEFRYYFYFYIILSITIPFTILFQHYLNKYIKIIAPISVIIGIYIGKFLFVYGGNAYPLSNRFGVGFEKYAEYDDYKDVIFFIPPIGEIAIVIGSVGIVLLIYNIAEALFHVSLFREDEVS